MIGLLVATHAEARPLIELLAGDEVSGAPLATYVLAAGGAPGGCELVIGGMGPDAAGDAAEYLIDRRAADVVVNVGICGALGARTDPGQIVRITDILDGDGILAGRAVVPWPCADGPWGQLAPRRLATVAEAVFDGPRHDVLAAQADVVDMEAVAIARACAERGVTLHVIKGVSDLADGEGKSDIQRSIALVSRELADVTAAGLAGLGPRSGPLATVMRFLKIEHTVFSLPLLFAGAWLGAGRGWPGAWVLGWIVVAGLAARALGMAMNRILDRDLDARNPRTAARELPAGRITLAAAWCVAAAALALYLGACAALGPLCLILAPVPAVVLGVYSLLKRFTCLCHFGIGLCLGMAPLAAYVAAAGTVEFGLDVMLLAGFAFCWISGFDIIYALMDIEFDTQAGVHSIPAALGPVGAQVVAAGTHVLAAGALAWLWVLLGRGFLSAAALGVVGGAFAAAYCQSIPVARRFFPISAVAGVAGAMVPILGGLP